MWMRALAAEAWLGQCLGGVCGFGASLLTPGAGALRLSIHPGAGGPTQPLGPLPLLALPAPVLRAGQMRGRQQNHGALGAFPHRRPRTSRRLHSGALRGCSGDRPPCGHGCGRRGGRPTEHLEFSLRLRRRYPSGAKPGVQRPGVRAPRARWHERRPACPGASPRSPLRRDGTAPWRVAIAAATRVGPGVDAGRQRPDRLGRRIAPVARASRGVATAHHTPHS